MNIKQRNKIVLAKDYIRSDGTILNAGHEVVHEDFEGSLVVISFEYDSGCGRFFEAVPPDFLEEITYGAISRQPFARTSTQTLDEERVLNLSWEDTILNVDGNKVFSNEERTCGDSYVHCSNETELTNALIKLMSHK